MTSDQLRAIMPGLPASKRDALFPHLQTAMAEFAIDTPAREAAFVAQLAHESGQFRYMEEIWGPTDAQRRYEPVSPLATRLGNTQPGDGKRFKGRGPIQLTGRANYQRFGGLLALNLESTPERAAVPDVAFRVAALFWTKNGLNELADETSADAFQRITRRINGGYNGLKDREAFYASACKALGVTVRAIRGRSAAPIRETTVTPALPRGHESIFEDARKKPRRPSKRRVIKKRKPARASASRRKPARAAAPRRKSTRATPRKRRR